MNPANHSMPLADLLELCTEDTQEKWTERYCILRAEGLSEVEAVERVKLFMRGGDVEEVK